MPYLRLQTNVTLEDPTQLLKDLSAVVSKVTGKPETYIQVTAQGGIPMLMAGNTTPTAHIEVKGIGFPTDKAKPMSSALCTLLRNTLNIDGARVFIVFNSHDGAMWGTNSGTFG